jgi:hypothetical protein
VLFFLSMSVPIRKKKVSAKADDVLLWHITEELKKRPAAAHSKRVRHIVERLIELKNHVGTYGAIQLLAELREPIDRYRFKYQLAVGSRVFVGIGAADPNASQDELWEYRAVVTLVKLLETPDGLNRVSKCECGSLFFAARRSDQKHCGNVCRQRSNDRDPEKRERKLIKMRERYAEMKRLAANPKSGVGLRATKRRVDG